MNAGRYSITLFYSIASALIHVLCIFKILKTKHLSFNFRLIMYYIQYYRYYIPAFYFGKLGLKNFFLFGLLIKYSVALETYHYRRRQADYLYILTIGNAMIIFLRLFNQRIKHFSPSIAIMILYLFCRKNAGIMINVTNLINLTGVTIFLAMGLLPFLSKIKEGKVIFAGWLAGHFCYYFIEIYPRLNGGHTILKTPDFLNELFERISQ